MTRFKYLLVLVSVLFLFVNCEENAESTSGVKKTNTTVAVGSNGLTIEQDNIKNRYDEDNKPGAIKHLYIISAYSGQTIIYSTVKGKVTSSGKRLSPYEVHDNLGFDVNFNGKLRTTREVLQDDGTYGSSEPYIFWWDTKSVYHQHYISGGQIVHVSNKPLSVKSVIINVSQ